MAKEVKQAWLYIVWTILGVLLFACIAIICFNITHTYHLIDGSSMYPTLRDQVDYVFACKYKKYKRGDIIVADSMEKDEEGNEKFVIKRLIAIGGDRVSVQKIDDYYRVVIIYAGEQDPTVLEEDYLSSYNVNQTLFNNFYVMYETYAKPDDEDGYLTIAEDEVFYLGDNREISRDCSIVGPQKKEQIVSMVDYIIYGGKLPYIQILKQLFGIK